jgi:phospholipid transport system substrate-binding protein
VSQLSAIRPSLVFGLICIVLVCASGRGVHAADTLPEDMVQAGMAKLADAALAHGNHSESSEQDLVDAVRLFLAEYTDVHYAACLIFAKYWEAATPGQRDRFVDAFNNQVTNRLVKFVPDIDFGSVRIDPFLGDTEESPLMIRATFRTSDKQAIHFVLAIHEREGRWLIFDVIAEGISYVKIYRNQFTGEITDTGLEAMIERFEIRSNGRGNG